MKASFQRLKWIPMIVKAYNQARSFQDVNSDVDCPALDTTDSTSIEIQPDERTAAKPQRSSSASVRSIPQKRRSVVIPPARVNNRRAVQKPRGVPYQQMLQELRQTKAKLDQFESIHRRLTESQVKLQSQLSQLLSQMKEQDTRPSDATQPDLEPPSTGHLSS